MHGFSTVDGFVEINENLAEMIKYVANEPSVGLFYVQQHTQNAVPNVIRLKNTVMEKSRETSLHTEDLEDSITMVSSMKESGFPILDGMIRDINKSLHVMSTKEPKRGLINNQSSSFNMGRITSWGPDTWGRNPFSLQQDGELRKGYISTVLESAKQKASNLKWSPMELKDSRLNVSQNLLSTSSNKPIPLLAANSRSNTLDMEGDELPVSNQVTEGIQADKVEEEDGEREAAPAGESSPIQTIFSTAKNYADFKADREARLKEWLEGPGNGGNGKAARDVEAFQQ